MESVISRFWHTEETGGYGRYSYRFLVILISTFHHNIKHSENADTSTSVTFDLEVCPWPFVKVKKADVIRHLYCTLVPGKMSMGLILYKISPIAYFMWPLTFICELQLLSRSLALLSLDVFNVAECLYQKWRVFRFIRIWNMDNCMEKT